MHLGIGDGVTHTRDHWWWRPGWRPGRRQLTFHLTFEGSGLAEATGPLRVALATLPALDVVPDPWLHLTLTSIGFADAVDPDAAGAVAEAGFAAAAALETGPLTFDSVFVGAEGVLLLPRPEPWLADLSRSTRAAVDQAVGPVERHPFWPHVSLAYAHGDVPAADVAAALSRPAAEASEIVARLVLSLLELGRDERVYTWGVRRRLPL